MGTSESNRQIEPIGKSEIYWKDRAIKAESIIKEKDLTLNYAKNRLETIQYFSQFESKRTIQRINKALELTGRI